MPDDHNPKPFTDAQRELFDAVTNLNRTKADDFAEADQWIDTKPPTEVEERQRYRQQLREEIAERRRRKDRSWLLDLPGEMIHRWRRWTPKDNAQQQEKAKVLAQWRRDRARSIRYAFECFAEKIREEQEHGPLRPCELIDLKASRFIRTSDPLVFDAMNPEQKALWARRLLRVVWILTDTADLTTTKLDWLREWKWGEHAVEFLVAQADGTCRPIPRLWSRTTILDRELYEWERLTRDALRALEEAEPGATALPETDAVREPLTPHAAKVYEMLLALPEHKAMTTKDILDRLGEKSIFIDESTFYNRIIKELEQYGLRNRPKVGYYIPLSDRPAR
ncbi:MAG: hypothetical protein ACREJC_05130 [Tepidisphaeraceae bacterium]